MMKVDLVDDLTVKAIDCMSPSSFVNQHKKVIGRKAPDIVIIKEQQFANQHSRTSSLQIKAHSTSSPSKRTFNAELKRGKDSS